ncbi:uncharacterized protein LAESUDRAFT_645635, partial [Laetiporus sulphureus 93-53]
WHIFTDLHRLRLHTESTISLAESMLKHLAHMLRQFKKTTCTAFAAVELVKEAQAHACHQADALSAATLSHSSQCLASTSALTMQSHDASVKRTKESNLNMYKLHSLPDYVKTIRTIGTTDSYTTCIIRV